MPRDKIILECTECKNRNFFTDEEQAEAPGAGGAAEVLPALQQAPRAQGIEVMDRVQSRSRRTRGRLDRADPRVPASRCATEMKKVTWPTRAGADQGDADDRRRSRSCSASRSACIDWLLQLILVDGVARARAVETMEYRWYAIQTTAGHENKVRTLIQRRIEDDPRPADAKLIRQALVPTQEVVEIKNGKKVTSSGSCTRATCWWRWR